MAAASPFSIPANAALAGQGDVIRRGSGSGRSDWKLKLSTQDGRIEVEFEVDQNVIGDRWGVTFRHDALRAPARNASTGEVCAGSASI